MKKQNQARRNSKSASRAAQPKAGQTARMRVTPELRCAIENGAKHNGVSISEFVRRAIREVLPNIEKAAAGKPHRKRTPKRGEVAKETLELLTLQSRSRGLADRARMTSVRIKIPKDLDRIISEKVSATGLDTKNWIQAAACREATGRIERRRCPRRPLPRCLRAAIMLESGLDRMGDCPELLCKFWRTTISSARWFDPAKEHLVTVILNTRYHISGYSLIGIGTVSEVVAHPREILRPVLIGAGYGFVVMHNHPSGDPSPSIPDSFFHDRVQSSACLLQLNFLDNIIVGEKSYFAFSEVGRCGLNVGALGI